MKIKDSVIIVTGASAGIGAATVIALANKGANVVLSARRQERLIDLISQTKSLPGERIAIAGDIQNEDFAHDMVEQTVSHFGRVDVLINNAGLGQRSGVADISSEDSRTILNTNILGLLYATQAAIPYMDKQDSGQIINISSIVGQRPMPMGGVYAASKTAVNFITRNLRMENYDSGIIFSTVYPGLTETEFLEARLGVKQSNRFGGVKGVPASRVADKIVKAIEKGRQEVYITTFDWALVHCCRLFPRSSDWVFSRLLAGVW